MSIRIDGTNTTANPGITGSDTDTGLQFATNEIKVVTDGSEKATFDSTGNFVLDGGSDVRIELGSNGTTATNDRNHIRGDGDNIKYNSCDTGQHIFEVNGTEAFRIESTRTTLRGDGEHRCEGHFRPWANSSYDLGTSGDRWRNVYTNGVLFNGDTAAVNTLNDYEEGTFSVVLEGSSTAGSPTYGNQSGTYTKIGRLVTCFINVSITNKGGMTGDVRIAGLPFDVDNVISGTGVDGGGFVNYYANIDDSAITGFGLLPDQGTDTATFYFRKAGVSMGGLEPADITSTFNFRAVVIYCHE